MTEEELAALIAQHEHRYDADCNEDYRCSCGEMPRLPDIEDDDPDWDYFDTLPRGRANYAKHLAAVITAAVKAAQPPFNS